ncbi:MAG: SCO family protein [Steroidobacterales bacterium]
MKSTAFVPALVVSLCWLCCRPLAAEPPPIHHHDMAGMDDMPAMDSVPGASLYRLDTNLETAEGVGVKLADLQGKPLIATMFYSHCTSVCPLLTTQLQHLVAALSPAERAKIRVLMVSFDSVRDTPEVLTEFKARHHIEDSNWLVARASASDVRTLAAALGIRYRELPDHSFNHSAVITLLDADGVPRARTQIITDDDAAFAASLAALLR